MIEPIQGAKRLGPIVEVMKAQRQVSEETIREYKRRIERIFDK